MKLPDYDAGRLDETAIAAMEILQQVVELGRNARDKRNVSLKMPLKNITYVLSGDIDEKIVNNLNADLKAYIMSELNVWSVTLVPASEENEWVKISMLPDLKKLGKKLGKSMGKVKQGIVNMTHEEAKAAISKGVASVEGFDIDFTTEVLCKFQFNREGEQWESAVNGAGTVVVAIDTTPDEELIAAGKARSFVSGYQKLRKSSGLKMGDPIEVFYLDQEVEMGKILASSSDVVVATLRGLPLPVSNANSAAVVVGESEVAVAEGIVVTIQLRRPTVALKDGLGEFVNQFMTSMSFEDCVKQEKVVCEIDGENYELRKGVDFWESASERAKNTRKVAWQ